MSRDSLSQPGRQGGMNPFLLPLVSSGGQGRRSGYGSDVTLDSIRHDCASSVHWNSASNDGSGFLARTTSRGFCSDR
jgi:hypothetical protein